MLSVSEARAAILARVAPLPPVRQELDDALGRVLAGDAVSAVTIPPFANSAMDGFAVRAADCITASEQSPVILRVIEDLPAGRVAAFAVTAGAALRIMTGAPVPAGADAVVPVELTSMSSLDVVLTRPVPMGANLREAGEDVRAGECVVAAGTVLRAAELGVLASIGMVSVAVVPAPRVALVTTGDELVDAATIPGPGQIRDSNMYSLTAQVRLAGGVPVRYPRIEDRLEAMIDVFRAARAGADVIVTNGAVSVGDYDFVKPALAALGADQVFWKVAQKPGKPLAFWLFDGVPVFGAPGNPVSAMVCFEEYVRPALRSLGGFGLLHRPEVVARLDGGYRKASADGKQHFARVVATETGAGWVARSTGAQGSGILSSMVRANALALIPPETVELPAGASVMLHLIDQPEDH